MPHTWPACGKAKRTTCPRKGAKEPDWKKSKTTTFPTTTTQAQGTRESNVCQDQGVRAGVMRNSAGERARLRSETVLWKSSAIKKRDGQKSYLRAFNHISHYASYRGDTAEMYSSSRLKNKTTNNQTCMHTSYSIIAKMNEVCCGKWE